MQQKINPLLILGEKVYKHPLVIKIHIILIKLSLRMNMMSVEVGNNFKNSKITQDPFLLYNFLILKSILCSTIVWLKVDAFKP